MLADPERARALDPAGDYRIAGEVVASCTQLQRELERVLGKREFYDKSSWAGVELTDEAKQLVKEDPAKLSDKRLRRRNRLLLEAAYPLIVRKSASLSVRPTYMGREIPQIPLVGAPSATTRSTKPWKNCGSRTQ